MTSDRHLLLAVPIREAADIVALRQRARRVAELLKLDANDQTRVATAVSEIGRNAFTHGGGGMAQFMVETSSGMATLVVRIADHGKGMTDVAAVLDGREGPSQSRGLIAARRLVDDFMIESRPGEGTRVELIKRLAPRADAGSDGWAKIAGALSREDRADVLTVIGDQNRELMRGLEELNFRQDELNRLNAELADTNRGVIALYAELDDKAEQLKRASELKSRFLSYMSHEFRTPLNSILALTRLLLDRVDGGLTPEQERQVKYIRTSSENMTEMVNDLLDLAKVEAGMLDVKTVTFTVQELFGGLRGALRPLLTTDAVDLVFEEVPGDMPDLSTDEGKVAQILRNFISNALKFTVEGEVRVSTRFDPAANRVLLRVRDTGVGIAPSEHERLFMEFSQIDNPLQKSVKGTGLGLSLSRRLAGLLGGEISVESELGAGAAFTLSIPPAYGGPERTAQPAAPVTGTGSRRVLIVDDEDAFRYVFRQMIGGTDIEIIEATNGLDGLNRARQDRPDLIVLDLQMPKLDGYHTLQELGADAATRATPVIISTSSVVSDEMRQRLARAAAIVSKESLSREFMQALMQKVMRAPSERIIPGAS